MSPVDLDAVGELIRQATGEAIVPRFRTLQTSEIEEKSPGELVTVADRDAEAIISRGLRAMLPGVPVIGEEAVAANPSLLTALRTEPMVWLVDPLDGTTNFIKGKPWWASLVALVRHGETIASWTWRHGDQCLYVAESGNGAWCNNRRLSGSAARQAAPASSLRGAVLSRFLTDDERSHMLPRLDEFDKVTHGYQCSGYEYPAIVEGEQDFALFQRLLPWDHAAGCLLLTETGGVAAHPDGSPFRPDHAGRRGLLLANSPETWHTVRAILYGRDPAVQPIDE